MSVVPTYKRHIYRGPETDPNVVARIQKAMDEKAGLPAIVPDTYPDRAQVIHQKAMFYVNADGPNPVYTEPSPLKKKEYIGDTLAVLAVFGGDKARIEANSKAIRLLAGMNPIPKIVVVEGSTEGGWYFEWVKELGNVDYIPVNLNYPQFRNFFVKESLWNVGAHYEMERDSRIKYLAFMDADTFFVDRYGWSDIRATYEKFDVFSPFARCYYVGDDPKSVGYGLLGSTGYHILRQRSGPGYQGFGLCISVTAYTYHFRGELPNPSLGLGDNLYWYMLTGNTVMKHFRMLPYEEHLLEPYIIKDPVRIGSTLQILGHMDHGPLDDRIYKVRSQLMKMAVHHPLGETQRYGDEGYIVGWSDTPEAKDLRFVYEHLLIENRRDVKILSYEDAKQYYLWLHGMAKLPPRSMMRSPFARKENAMPNWECSIQIPDKKSTM